MTKIVVNNVLKTSSATVNLLGYKRERKLTLPLKINYLSCNIFICHSSTKNKEHLEKDKKSHILTYFPPFSSVSIIDFEQVNVTWLMTEAVTRRFSKKLCGL